MKTNLESSKPSCYLTNSVEPNLDTTDMNAIKIIKNNIYRETCEIFKHNLKKLIQIEGTQKKLAFKIGISQDLLSKYKSGEAFPSIETLIYICKLYNLDLNKFLSVPLNALDMERLIISSDFKFDCFLDIYHVYFLVTNLNKEGAIHEGIMEFSNSNVVFRILSNNKIVKSFYGTYTISDKLVFFNLYSNIDGNAYINMIKPNINKNKYVGGIGLLLLPSDANSKPCVQKILFSKTKLNRDLNFNELKTFLSFNLKDIHIENLKLSSYEDEIVYNFIESLS